MGPAYAGPWRFARYAGSAPKTEHQLTPPSLPSLPALSPPCTKEGGPSLRETLGKALPKNLPGLANGPLH